MTRIPQFLCYFLAATVADVICGGAVSALLQTKSPYWQAINDIYQFTYFVMVIAFGLNVKYLSGIACYSLLFLGMVEDTLFYLLVAAFNWAILLLTGTIYHSPKGLFPPSIGSWFGWILRHFGIDFELPTITVFLINAGAILAVVRIQLERRRRD